MTRRRPPVAGPVALLVALAGLNSCATPVDTSWHQEPGYRWRTLDVPRRGRDGFTPLDSQATGITHANVVSDEDALANRNLIIGAGVAIADVDGDGLPDIFLASVERPSALYHNAGGMKFVDVTASSGLDLNGLAATSAVLADVDGDGDTDLLVGTLGGPIKRFRNDGKGHFTDATATSGLTGGLAATTMTLADVDGDGDQRGAAAADFDGDGRVDLAVTQNGAATRLFRNHTGTPGLRVHLEGGAHNRLGIGAQLRVVAGGKRGPVREVRAGTGYWSMDGAVTVLARPAHAEAIEVRWPGGGTQTVPVGADQLDVTIRRP